MLFIPALLRREVNDLERDLISLPARLGGMGICKPTDECLISHTNSIYVSAPLVRLVERQEFDFEPAELLDQIKRLRGDVDKENETRNKAKLELILEHAPAELKIALKAVMEKGASSWVTAVPSYDHGTILHKGEFTVRSICATGGHRLTCLPHARVVLRSASNMLSTASSVD